MVGIEVRNRRRQARTQRQHVEVVTNDEAKAHDPAHEARITTPLSESQHEFQVQKALTRFVRNKSVPEELEILRYNLIAARVISGMTAVEAAERFGYANSTQLSLIESGGRPPPRDWAFLRQAAQVYSVSLDFLLGLSPHMDLDGKVAQQYALMRGTEAILSNLAASFASSMIHFTEQTQPLPEDFQRVSDAVERTENALNAMRDRYGFDDIPGGAPLMAAVDGLSKAVAPIRIKLKKFRSIAGYFDEMRAGKMPVVPYLMERYDQNNVIPTSEMSDKTSKSFTRNPQI
jgi:transcriptional regulator with XRE-family HTH domain